MLNEVLSKTQLLLSKTGSFDRGYQSQRYESSKNNIAKAIATLVVLFSMVGISDMFILEEPLSVLRLRLLFSPSFILLIALLYLGRSFVLFYISSSLVLGGSAICYALYIYDGSSLIAMYCTAVFSLTLLAMMPFLQTPLWLSLIPSVAMVASLALITRELAFTEWFFCGGTLIGLLNIVFFSEFSREIDEYEIHKEQSAINSDQQKKLQWSFMTGRLMRHELSNQLIALSSSLDMMHRTDQVKNKQLIKRLEKQTNSLRHEINELALASEWSAREDTSANKTQLYKVAKSAFASYGIELSEEHQPRTQVQPCASENICLYALNRLAGTIHKEFKELGLWGQISFPSEDATLFEIYLRSLPTKDVTAVHLLALTTLSNETSDISAARNLLETEEVFLNLKLTHNEIRIEFKRISDRLAFEHNKVALSS